MYDRLAEGLSIGLIFSLYMFGAFRSQNLPIKDTNSVELSDEVDSYIKHNGTNC